MKVTIPQLVEVFRAARAVVKAYQTWAATDMDLDAFAETFVTLQAALERLAKACSLQ